MANQTSQPPRGTQAPEAPLSSGLAAAYVAHEIANILTPVRMRAQLAMRHAGDADRVTREVEQILLATQRALEAAETVVRASRESACKATTAPALRAVIDEICAEYGTPEIPVTAYGTWQDCTAALPADEFRVVVSNLVRNAVDILSKSGGGGVKIRLLPPEACSTGNTPLLALEVADTGPGVAPSVGSGLFEPFTTSRQGRPGLGLSLCRDLLQRRGGSIRLLPDATPGTTFRIELPVEEGSEPQLDAGITTTSAGSTASR